MQMNDAQCGLAEKNIGLVGFALKSVKGFDSTVIGMDDLYQAGCIGLCKAAVLFDSAKGFGFSTFAVKLIYHEMWMLMRYECQPCRDAKKRVSLDADMPTDSRTATSFADMLPAKDNTEDQAAMWMALEWLSRLDGRDSLMMQMLLDGSTQNEIAETCGISQCQVSRCITKIRRKLQAEILDTAS